MSSMRTFVMTGVAIEMTSPTIAAGRAAAMMYLMFLIGRRAPTVIAGSCQGLPEGSLAAGAPLESDGAT